MQMPCRSFLSRGLSRQRVSMPPSIGTGSQSYTTFSIPRLLGQILCPQVPGCRQTATTGSLAQALLRHRVIIYNCLYSQRSAPDLRSLALHNSSNALTMAASSVWLASWRDEYMLWMRCALMMPFLVFEWLAACMLRHAPRAG